MRLALLIARLPLSVLYRLAWLLYVIAYYLLSYRYKVVYHNLQHAYPEKSQAELQSIARQFYRYLAEWVVEILKLPALSADEIKQRCRITDNDAFAQLQAEKHGAMVLTAHLGNWEWAGQRVGLALDQPLSVVYKQLSNKTVNRFMNHVRTCFGNEIADMREISRKLMKTHERNLVSSYLADQSPLRRSAGYWPTFMNRPAPFFTGPAKAAVKLNLPVYYGHIERVKQGYYQVTFHKLAEACKDHSPEAITEAYVRHLEASLKLQPANWLWSHRRWKKTHLAPQYQDTD